MVYKAIILTAYFNIYIQFLIFVCSSGLILFFTIKELKKYKYKGVTMKSYSLIFVCSHSF